MRKAVSCGLAAVGGEVHDRVIVQNNPVNLVDPSGLQTAVIINGPTSGNPFGHATIAFTGSGVYSFGNDYRIGGSMIEYLEREAPRRDTTIIVINTTTAQENIMKTYLQNLKGKTLQKWPDNCAERTSKAMNAANMPYYAWPTSWPSDVAFQANRWQKTLGGTTYYVPKGSTNIPSALKAFGGTDW